MGFDDFIRTAWDEHADHPEAVATRLQAARPSLTATDVAPWARLWVHLSAEHLAQWERGVAELESLRGATEAATWPVIDRSIAALRVAGGADDAADALAPADRVIAQATAATALAGRGDWPRALSLFDAAMQCADATEAGHPDASRALAVAGNNIAAALEEKLDRSALETAAMVRAAHAGLTHWAACGGWLETERAAFRVASCALSAGDPAQAVAAARQCVAVCAEHAADDFECFFAQAMLARALHAAGDPAFADARQAALARFAKVPDDLASWCQPQLTALQALPG